MHLVMIGGSDAGISAALRARELDPAADVTVVLEDAYPNFSICGIPYYVSGEVTHWRNLAHRTIADLEAAGMRLRLDTTARRIDVPGRKLLVTSADGAEELLGYDKLIVGTGAVPVRPPISGLAGPGALGPADGVHLLHSMGDTFAVMAHPGAGRPGQRGHRRRRVHRPGDGRRADRPRAAGHPDGAAARGAAHRRPGAGRAGPRRTGRPWRGGADRHHRPGDQQGPARPGRAAARPGHRGRRHGRDPRGRHGPGRRRGAARDHPGRRRRGRLGVKGAIAVDRGDADQPAGCVRRRGLRDHPPPAARRDLPAAGHHRAQAGPGRRGERPRREPAVRGQPRHPGGEDLRPGRRPDRAARPRSQPRPGSTRSPSASAGR